MHSLFSFALPLALAGSALANPLMQRGDACLAAVTGGAALGDSGLRSSHCSSFIKTIVTPSATTTTVTITATPEGWSKRAVDERAVTVCPNEVPNYASACNEDAYKSACSVFGIYGDTTFTIPQATSTVTIYNPYGGNNGNGGVCTSTSTNVITSTVSACSGGTTTVTSTTTESTGTTTVTSTTTSISFVGQGSVATSTTTSTTTASTTISVSVTVSVTADPVTVTVSATAGVSTTTASSGNCLNAAQAQVFVDAFTTLLEYTSYNGTSAPPGRGYQYNVSAQYLAEDFQDYSDSINWMAGFDLTTVTFNGRDAFDYGQGVLQPELTMTTLNVDFGCKTVHWRWSALTPSYANVRGINYFTISDDLTQIVENYSEFNNADWIQSFSSQLPTISCVVPGGLTTSAKRAMPRSY